MDIVFLWEEYLFISGWIWIGIQIQIVLEDISFYLDLNNLFISGWKAGKQNWIGSIYSSDFKIF